MPTKKATAEYGQLLPTARRLRDWDEIAPQMTSEDWEKSHPGSERKLARYVIARMPRANLRCWIKFVRCYLADKKKGDYIPNYLTRAE